MREYRQLTDEDRIEIYAMKQAGKQQNEIAVERGVHPSTVSRELLRNTGLRGYRPKQAHQKTLYRRFTARKAVKMTSETMDYMECKLAQEHSPEQIADWEGDTVVGQNHQGALVTLVGRTHFKKGYSAFKSSDRNSHRLYLNECMEWRNILERRALNRERR